MFKRLISNIRYWIGSKDMINGHKNLRLCQDTCTMYTLDHDGKGVSCFTTNPKHVALITEALASIINEVEGDNG